MTQNLAQQSQALLSNHLVHWFDRPHWLELFSQKRGHGLVTARRTTHRPLAHIGVYDLSVGLRGGRVVGYTVTAATVTE